MDKYRINSNKAILSRTNTHRWALHQLSLLNNVESNTVIFYRIKQFEIWQNNNLN